VFTTLQLDPGHSHGLSRKLQSLLCLSYILCDNPDLISCLPYLSYVLCDNPDPVAFSVRCVILLLCFAASLDLFHNCFQQSVAAEASLSFSFINFLYQEDL